MPEEAPDSAFELRQSSGGPRMTRSAALRVPTAWEQRGSDHARTTTRELHNRSVPEIESA